MYFQLWYRLQSLSSSSLAPSMPASELASLSALVLAPVSGSALTTALQAAPTPRERRNLPQIFLQKME